MEPKTDPKTTKNGCKMMSKSLQNTSKMQLFPAQIPPTRFNTFFLQISTNFNLILSIFGDKNRHLGGKGDPENFLGGPRPQKNEFGRLLGSWGRFWRPFWEHFRDQKAIENRCQNRCRKKLEIS